MKRCSGWRWGLPAVVMMLTTAVAWIAWRNHTPDAPPARPFVSTPAGITRGAYLARVGNCAACHSTPGGAPYAGGPGVATPFGTVQSPNLTPDAATGLGLWTADDFWRALHHGRSRDGRLLYPAFPYPQFTQMPRDDVDALYAYLRSLPPVQQARAPHALRWPMRTQAALAAWRALYFTPGSEPAPSQDATPLQRGAYLVNGPAHCLACHGSRNALGATIDHGTDGGSLLPGQHWYAPSLHAADEAGVADWPTDDIVALLKTGQSPRGSVQGPMAEVVFHGTQYLHDDDLQAMAVYLKALPQRPPAPPAPATVAANVLTLGQRLYQHHCADCHGEQGQGAVNPAGAAYPPLAGNRVVTMTRPDNLIRIVLEGGFGPSTAGHPRPYGMPPFEQTLSDDELAALLSTLRSSWGHQAAPVAAIDVLQRR